MINPLNNPSSRSDAYWMEKALKLALKAKGKTSPNPLVGAVLVKNQKIIASGYHHQAGKPHAEVEALSRISKSQSKNAILYVTLEPCSHFGRTPPCTNFLIKKGIKKIIIAMQDPNPKVAGKGIAYLKKQGVNVKTGILEEKAKMINESYLYAIQKQKPFCCLFLIKY